MQKQLDITSNEYFNQGPVKLLGCYFDPDKQIAKNVSNIEHKKKELVSI